MKYIKLLLFLALAVIFNVTAQTQVYQLDASKNVQNIQEGHIKVESHPNTPHQFGVNSSYFLKDGKPWFPLMGEFHYNRYPHKYWEEEILKMKSAGLSIVATYVFWNAHENPKGTWNWKDNLNMKKFIELCQKHQMYVWLRIGPWSHGEQLHGGHPDWINKMKGKRSNDPEYLKASNILYAQIGEQTKGLFYKDGGPIIGTQLENEYASGQAEHIDTLKEMALRNHITPVFFSLTANTVFKDKEFGYIPLQGSYPYRGWESGGGKPTTDFLYGKDQWIMGSAFGGRLYYDPLKYPRGLCEQGCGSQMTYRNRFTVEPHVVEAHLQNQIGRGMNLVGYYMFQGSTQMPGLKEPGYPESYDFQSPITEFGQLRPSYRYLKILHHFVNDFGEDLAEMEVVSPENPIMNERNTDSLRYVARVKENSGYLFLCNTQVRIPMPDKTVKFTVQLPDETMTFPRKPFTLKGETTAILPFNMSLNSALLKYATAQPLSKIEDVENDLLVLMELKDVPVELAFDAKTIKKISAKGWKKTEKDGVIYLIKENGKSGAIRVNDKNGKCTIIQLVSRQQAENSWRISIQGKESMVITNADLMLHNNGIELRQLANPNFEMDIYPAPKNDDLLFGNKKLKGTKNGIFNHYTINLNTIDLGIDSKMLSSDKATVQIPQKLPQYCSDAIVEVDYLGGMATVAIDERIMTDHLYHGPNWQLGLKRYMDDHGGKNMEFTVLPWSDEITGIPQKTVKKVKEKGRQFNRITIKPEYRILINQ